MTKFPFAHQQWIPLAALARYLGCTTKTLLRWLQAAAIEAVRMSSRHYTDSRPRKTERAHWYIERDKAERFVALYRSGALS